MCPESDVSAVPIDPASPVPGANPASAPVANPGDGPALPEFVRCLLADADAAPSATASAGIDPEIGSGAVIELSSPHGGVVHNLGGDHPLTKLHGLVCTDDVAGLAVVATGRVSADHSSATFGPGDRLRVVHVLWRDACAQSLLVGVPHRPDGPMVWSETPAEGLIPDAMARALELATPAPSSSPVAYWFLAWLLAVVDGMSPGAVHGELSPVRASRLHPGIDPREVSEGIDDEAGLVAFCVQRLRDHAVVADWESIRLSAAAGWMEVGRCDPESAAWFDEGSFSRWCEANLISPAEALAFLGHDLSERTRSLFEQVLGRLSGLAGFR